MTRLQKTCQIGGWHLLCGQDGCHTRRLGSGGAGFLGQAAPTPRVYVVLRLDVFVPVGVAHTSDRHMPERARRPEQTVVLCVST